MSAPLRRRGRPGRPAARGLPRRVGHRRAEARRAGRRSPPSNRSAGAPAWARSAGSAPAALDLGLTIRTAAADGDRLHLWAGGGITWDSDPAAEVAEAAAKAAPMRALLAAG